MTKGYGQNPDLVAVVIDGTRSGYVSAVVTGGSERRVVPAIVAVIAAAAVGLGGL